MDLSAARTDPYISLANTLLKQDAETLAVNLRRIQQQAINAVLEQASTLAKKRGSTSLSYEILALGK